MDDYNQYGGGAESQYSPEQDLTGQILYQGNIHDTNLTDLFFIIINEGKVGILEVWEGEYRKRIHFRLNGVSVTNIAPTRSTMLLGNQLIDIGRISQEQLDMALQEQQNAPRLIGEILIEKGLTTLEEVMALLRRQIKQDIFEIFFWPNLEYQFYEGESLYETPHVDLRLSGMTFDTSKYVVDLANVLSYLVTLDQPGTFFIQTPQRQLDLYFNGENIEFSNYGSEKQIRLGELLIEKGWLTQEALDQGLVDQQQSEGGGFLGEILVFRGYITEEHLVSALKSQMAREFAVLFGEEQVSYSYLSGGSPTNKEDRTSIVSIPLDLRRLVMDSFIVVDDWEQFIAMIPNCINVFPYNESGEMNIQNIRIEDIASQLHSQVNQRFDVQSISEMLALPDFETCILLSHFIRNVLLQSSSAFQKVAETAQISNNHALAISALNQARVYMPWDVSLMEALIEHYRKAGNKAEAAAFKYELAFMNATDKKNVVAALEDILKIDSHHLESRKYLFEHYLTTGSHGKADDKAIPHGESLFDYYKSKGMSEEARNIANQCQSQKLEILKFAQKTVDMYSELKDNPHLVEALQNLAEQQKENKRFEGEYHTLRQLRELSGSNKAEIDSRIKVLRRMGIGVEDKGSRIPYIALGVGIFIVVVVFLIEYFSSGTSKSSPVAPEIALVTLTDAEALYENQSAPLAVKALQELFNWQGEATPEVNKARELTNRYQSHEKERQDIIKRYHNFKKEGKWQSAWEELNNLDSHTPKKRQKERGDFLDKERDEIKPYIETLREKLKEWFESLRTQKTAINDNYVKKQYVEAENNIQKILNTEIETIIDSENVRQELDAAIKFAKEVENNIAKRRFEIAKNDPTTVLEKTKKYRESILYTAKAQGNQEALKLINRYVIQSGDGFIENYKAVVLAHNSKESPYPVAELYRLSRLLEELKAFNDLAQNPPSALVIPLALKEDLKKMMEKVQQDYDSLYTEHGEKLNRMKEKVRELKLVE
jgi:hypothetical protein